MLRIATVPLLTLILLMPCGESEGSVVVSSGGQECEGYWVSSTKYHCPSPSAGGRGQSRVGPQPASLPTAGGTPAAGKTSVGSQRQKMRGSVTSSAVAERTSPSAPDSKEVSPMVTGQPSDVAAGSRNDDQVAKPPEGSRVSVGAASSVAGSSGQRVGQKGEELETSERNAKDSNRGDKGGERASGEQIPEPIDGIVVQPPTRSMVLGSGQGKAQGVQTVEGQLTGNKEEGISEEHAAHTQARSAASGLERRNTLDVLTGDGDEHEFGEGSAERKSSGVGKGRAVLLAAAFNFM